MALNRIGIFSRSGCLCQRRHKSYQLSLSEPSLDTGTFKYTVNGSGGGEREGGGERIENLTINIELVMAKIAALIHHVKRQLLSSFFYQRQQENKTNSFSFLNNVIISLRRRRRKKKHLGACVI